MILRPFNKIESNGTLAARFWRKVQKSSGCWLWTGSKIAGSKYGRIRVAGAGSPMVLANRVAWFIKTGNDPGHLLVCHTCDNPPCVNPDHLFLATNHENILDMKAKGRHLCGEKNDQSKLSGNQVMEIRQKYLDGSISMSKLAKSYGVTAMSIHRAIRKKSWAHL
jgi:hypothetical protein